MRTFHPFQPSADKSERGNGFKMLATGIALLTAAFALTNCSHEDNSKPEDSSAGTNQPAASSIASNQAPARVATNIAPASVQTTTGPRPSGLVRPCIILILADSLGYGDLGCYGQTAVRTPNIDRLAAEGMRFTSFYAGSPLSEPSRCALMTGLNSGHGSIRSDADQPLRPEDVTLAQILKMGGYRTCMVGEWLLGDENSASLPQNKGFDQFAGFLTLTSAQNYFPEDIRRYSPPLIDPRSKPGDPIVMVPEFNGPEPLFENYGDKRGLYVQDLFTKAAQNFTRIATPTTLNHFQPFFLFLAYTSPRPAGSGVTVPGDSRYADEPWPQPEKNQALMLTHLDDDIGKLMSAINNLSPTNGGFSLARNTIVILTSDTGPHQDGGVNPDFFHSSGPWRGHKGDLYEGGIRVPLIVNAPGWIRPGQVNDSAWAAWDLLPTLAELAGAKPETNLDGISMVPMILGQAQTNRHEFLYWESQRNGIQQAARLGDWKALRLDPGQPLALYDLKSDPGEKNDVAKENPGVVAKFEEYFKTRR